MKAKLLVLAIGLLPVLAYGAGNDNWMYNLEREKERQAAEAQTPVRNCRDRSQSLVDPDSELGRRIKFCK